MRPVPGPRPRHLRAVPGPPAPAPRDEPVDEPVTVAIAGAEFGWGSSGKLSAVLGALRERSGGRPPRIVGLGTGLGRPLLTGHPVASWYDLPGTAAAARDAVAGIVRAQGVRAALVVLDGPVAMALEAAGVPTVFVDSLPFLWTDGDRDALPLEASAYCAQRAVELPAECRGVLAAVRHPRWVEAVVAAAPGAPTGPGARADGSPYRTALVSLGGLRAPRLADPACYPRAVVPAVLAALAAHGVQEAHIAGNLPDGLAARLTAGPAVPPRVTAGPLPHDVFLRRLGDCDVLLASPGLTTLLEAGRTAVPTVCLPPQNLSQIFNGRFHSRAVGADVRVTWPGDVLSEEAALALRSGGEDSALELIYGGIARAAAGDVPAPGGRTTRDALREGVLAALRRAAGGADWGGLTAAVGTGGAAQVADALLEIARRAPLPA
ncbi:hydroxymethylcytosylglucuronate/cytosylglucuronate synthase [Streptomyces sp. NPDC037389]|uniref:hydroxymethylcytosylglucuronate/cytosylglucurona te synthase n=1 Tax=Streptomyces sp. NPDC037389 TaxID=3155369 RepID=UPI0033FDA5BD